uniref:Uncharacterized protein n=1 Tax=Alexandrium monilatum TaxID=311494 RepID=A0A7S4Q1B9_9DINO
MAADARIMRLNYSSCEVRSVELTPELQAASVEGFAITLCLGNVVFGLSLLAALCRSRQSVFGFVGGAGKAARRSSAWLRSVSQEDPPLLGRGGGVRLSNALGSPVEQVRRWWLAKMNGQPVVFRNYIRCLGILFFTFLCLFVLSYALDASGTSARTGWGLSMMFQRGKFFEELVRGHSEGLQYLIVGVVLKGIVLLASTVLLEIRCEQQSVSEEVRSTIWVHGLPVKDQRMTLFLRETFELTADELKRVGTDLASVIEEQIRKNRGPDQLEKSMAVQSDGDGEWVVDEWDSQMHPRGTAINTAEYQDHWHVSDFIGAKGIYFKPEDKSAAVFVRKVAVQEASRVARVWVMPNVQKWRKVANDLERAICCQEACDEWMLRYEACRGQGTSCWTAAWHSWYRWRSDVWRNTVQRLEVKLLEIRLRKLNLNGGAFVQFRSPKDASRFLGKPPEPVDCLRWWCWYKSFKFGHIPFSSVTLEYEPAPHPDDIIWDNMDTPRWIGWLLIHVLACVLYAAVLAIAVSINLPMAFAKLVADRDMYDCLSPFLLLVVNGTISPRFAEWITFGGRFWRKTDVELRHFKFNYWLMIWSMVLVRLLRGSRLQHWPDMVLDGRFLNCMLWDLHLDPGEISLGYLFDVLFLTNAYQVVSVERFRLIRQLRERLMTVRAMDNSKVGPPTFPFSFHYAWMLSVVALALWTSNEVPGILLLAAIYLLVKVCIDWCNLISGVYEIGSDYGNGVFMNQIIFCLRMIISIWWLMSGTTIMHFCKENKWEEHGCPRWAPVLGHILAIFALVILAVSMLRRAYVDNIRRFIQGWLQKEPELEGEEDILFRRSATPKLSLYYPTASLRDKPREGLEEGPDWDARPPFGSQDVEEIISAIRMRPSLEGPVFQGLREGKTVQEVLRQVRGFRRTCSEPCKIFA